jgi:flagellar assembly factor FliW
MKTIEETTTTDFMSNHYTFPQGIPGFSEHSFFLTPIHSSKKNFFTMRNEDGACFVIKMIHDDPYLLTQIKLNELQLLIKKHNMDVDYVSIGLMTQMHPDDHFLMFQFNAPLVFDAESKTGWQFVL